VYVLPGPHFGLAIFLTIFFATASIGRAETAQDPAHASGGEPVMNGIQYGDYPDFVNKWRLITVRYRVDSSEQRFTFANESAYATLIAGRTDYPKGAVFGKVGIMTKDDPSFASSKVPSGTMRYQFMVRDEKKYAETGGWGYALFNAQGVRYNTPVTTETVACFACHQLVKAKGYVFSEPMLGFGNSAFKTAKASAPIPLEFAKRSTEVLPAVVRSALPKKFTQLFFYSGAMREHLFQGSLNEMRPLLTQQVKKSGLPAALVSTDGERCVVVAPADPQVIPGQTPCAKGLVRYLVIERDPVTEGPFLQLHAFCDSAH
jgi:hypothetical protein